MLTSLEIDVVSTSVEKIQLRGSWNATEAREGACHHYPMLLVYQKKTKLYPSAHSPLITRPANPLFDLIPRFRGLYNEPFDARDANPLTLETLGKSERGIHVLHFFYIQM